MRTFYSAIFRSNGAFTKTDTYGCGMACEDGKNCDREAECGICTSEETGIWHTDGNKITMKYDGKDERTEIKPYKITTSDADTLLEIGDDFGPHHEYRRAKRPTRTLGDVLDAMYR